MDMTANAALPFLISWNVTKRCNLSCAHCYLDAEELDGKADEPASAAWRVIDDIASVNRDAMLILTGGEPLLRPDIFDIARYASEKGLTVVLGTNGTLLDDDTVKRLVKSGVKGAGISLDSAGPLYHDRFRGVKGAWEKTIDGMEALKRHGVDFQIQFTVTKENRDELPAIIDLSIRSGARAVNVFFLVCTGRGQEMTDLSAQQYEDTLKYLVKAEDGLKDSIMVRTRCAPHFLRVASSINPESSTLKGATSGCIAGRGYLRISPEGFVTPCPYMPVGKGAFNLKDKKLKDILDDDGVFKSLRNPQYHGKCADCEYDDICGGCRARALASSNDMMGEDPWCSYVPQGSKGKRPVSAPLWSAEAGKRLDKVPAFLRSTVKKGVERYAASKGLEEITPELMAELKGKTGR